MNDHRHRTRSGFGLLGLLIGIAMLAVIVFGSFYAGKFSEQKSIIDVSHKALDQVAQLSKSVTEHVQPVTGSDSGGKQLDLSRQGLRSLPAYVLEMKQLEVLDLSGNQLTGALPAEIRFLQNLRELNVSHNAMTGIPAEVGQLSHLELLDYSYNQITGLPNEIGHLTNLKTLNLTGNNFSQQDLSVITKQIPNLHVIY